MGHRWVRALMRMWRWWIMADTTPASTDDYFGMTMIGLSHFFGRLDPLVMAGVDFHIHNEGIMVSAFIPQSQLRNMLVKSEFE